MGPYSCQHQSVSIVVKVGSLAILQSHTTMGIGSREGYRTDRSQGSFSDKLPLEHTEELMSMILGT